jgi:hypothetical protein
VAITVHFEKGGVPRAFLLDIVEVAKSHTGVNLAAAFVEVLEAFGIKDRVSDSNTSPKSMPRLTLL